MIDKVLGLGVLTLSLSGCVVWDAGYTANKDVAGWDVLELNRFPITYSVSLSFERNDILGAPEQQALMRKIEEALQSTGLFSEVSYGTGGVNSSYHIAFTFHQAGMREEDSMAVGLLAGYTLLLVPTGEVISFDGSAVLSLKGEALYSTAKAEELRCLVWLPMVPFGFFMNAWSVWHYAEKGTVNALVNDIADFHRRRFLSDVDVRAHKDEQ